MSTQNQFPVKCNITRDGLSDQNGDFKTETFDGIWTTREDATFLELNPRVKFGVDKTQNLVPKFCIKIWFQK